MHACFKRLAVAALLALPVVTSVEAAPCSLIHAFGSSLSDVGNVLCATAGTPVAQPLPPCADGQLSNGPVWLQMLASSLRIAPSRPSLAGGTRSGATPTNAGSGIDPPAHLAA